MAITTWPTFRAQDPMVRVTFVDKNIIQESEGGQEFRLNLQPTTRFRYTFTYNGFHPTWTITAPGQDYNGDTEIAALRRVRLALLGTWGQINITDPLTNSTVVVRLESDELQIAREPAGNWWSGDVTFISVL